MSQTEWSRVPERGSWWVMRLGIGILNVFGYWVGLLAASLAVVYFFVTGGQSRRASRDYLYRLYRFHPQPRCRPNLWNSFRHHWHFGITALDRLWFWQGKMDQFQFTRRGRRHVADRTGGLLLMGAHFGSFDAMRAFSKDKGLKVNVVMYRSHARKFNSLLKKLNPESNVNIVELDGSDIHQVFNLKERVEAGEVVAILGDRPAPYGTMRLMEVPFLKDRAPFPQNPWILASLLECPVYFTVGVRTGMRRYHIEVVHMADRIVLPRATREENIRNYIEDYVARLEKLCTKHPYQWFNFYDFWSGRERENEAWTPLD